MLDIQQQEEYDRLMVDLRKANKIALIEALAGTHITKITAEYYGRDSVGGICKIAAFDCEGKEMTLPSAIVPIKSADYDYDEKVHIIETNDLALKEAVEAL